MVKSGLRYSIHLAWAMEAQASSTRMVSNLLRRSEDLQLLPEMGRRRTLIAPSLRESGVLGTQILSNMLARSPQARYFEYTPFAFFHLANPEAENRYMKLLGKLNVEYNLAIGVTTRLDSRVPADVKREVPSSLVRFVHSPIRHYCAFIGGCAVEAYFDQRWLGKVETQLTSRVTGSTWLARLYSTLAEPAPIKIIISREKAAVNRARKMFSSWFDL